LIAPHRARHMSVASSTLALPSATCAKLVGCSTRLRQPVEPIPR